MANDLHLSLIKKDAKAWKDLLRQQGVRVDLSEADLNKVDLSGMNLREANLSGADVSGANVIFADLSEADLSGANLSEANLSGANLSEANLSGANLSRAILRWAKLTAANLSEADLSGANLSWANLSGANLTGANLTDAHLMTACLRKTDLSAANLSRADLSGVNLRGANLRGANLRGADLSWADLSEADLSGADLSGADLRWANLPILDEIQESRPEALLSLRFPGDQTVEQLAILLAALNLLYRDDIKFDHSIGLFQYEAPPLTIRSLHISSPGWLEVVGALNPLTFIHNMTKLILDHIAANEKRRLSEEEQRLKNEKLMIKIVDQKAELLRKWGVAEERIQEGIIRELLGEGVSRYSKAVEKARVVSVDYKELPNRGDQLAAGE
jgi:uncharacterized protein YjbI with pentapeptide repeats